MFRLDTGFRAIFKERLDAFVPEALDHPSQRIARLYSMSMPFVVSKGQKGNSESRNHGIRGMRSVWNRGLLRTGVIVGTVEIVGCRKVRGEYEWDLVRPIRLKRPLKPKNHPQLAWFIRSENQ
jgi:hypothetical protein